MRLILNFERSWFFYLDFSIGFNFPRTRLQRNTFNRIFSRFIFIQTFMRNGFLSWEFFFTFNLLGLNNFLLNLLLLHLSFINLRFSDWCFSFRNLRFSVWSFSFRNIRFSVWCYRLIKLWLRVIIAVSDISQFVLKVFYFINSFIQFIQYENLTKFFVASNIFFISIRENTSIPFTHYYWLIFIFQIGLLRRFLIINSQPFYLLFVELIFLLTHLMVFENEFLNVIILLINVINESGKVFVNLIYF